MADSLERRVAIVTGAGGAIGGAIAQRLIAAGARVMLADENDQSLSAAVANLKAPAEQVAKFHVRAHDRLGAANMLAATLDAFDDVDILVNIPRSTQPGSFADLDGAGLSEALQLNVVNSFLLAQAVARHLVERLEADRDAYPGTILNVSSIAARRTVPELLAYSVSCAGLDQLTRSMSADLASYGIRVNGIALGAVMTERMRQVLRERDDLRAELVRVTPLGRIGEAEEAAGVALFLLSSAASFVTGEIVTVDGGRSVLDPLASPVR
ncbi:MAG: SDR family oxidoreductase [Pseudomonadota bacterium]